MHDIIGISYFSNEQILKELQNIYEAVSKNNHLKFITEKIREKRGLFIEAVKNLRNIRRNTPFNSQNIDKNFLDLLKFNNMEIDFYPIKTRGDGNCFYYSLSYILFSSFENFLLLKICIIFIFLEYEKFFRNYFTEINSEVSYEEALLKMVSRNSWADFTVNVCATILLNRTIYSISIHQLSKRPHRIKYYLSDNDQESPILIAFYINHFVPILSKERNFKVPDVQHELDALDGQRENLIIDLY